MKIDISPDNKLSNKLHIDLPLLLGIITLMCMGLVIMYSASGQSMEMMEKQALRMLMSIVVMFVIAQIHPRTYESVAEILYILGVLLLFAVIFVGESANNAQRWLNLGIVRFQPSEILKLIVPLMIAKYIAKYPLPPNLKTIVIALVLLFLPTVLIFVQPDLGTAILIAASGVFVIFLAGISWRIILAAVALVGALIPVMWLFVMKEYQKTRVRTLFDPESDPLGAGYHIIQSKIAIGSGGWRGKGWLEGTQSQLEFIPERHTDFIFAVIGEEWGTLGVLFLLCVYLFIIARALYLANKAQTAFGRMLAGSVVLSFFVYVFVNIGMVSGILPVVGVPLPLISYGGTSMITLMAGFGLIMSIHTHRKLISELG